jgi:biotin carboxyl carrier protein
MYQVKVNDKFDFEIEAGKNELIVDGKPLKLDLAKLTNRSSHVIFDRKSYTVELEEINPAEKTALVKVNGNRYSIQIKDQFDQLLAQLGMDNLAVSKILQVKAPMPGLVLNVLVAEGIEVKKGDNLLVLEAMKMENMIKSPTDGRLKKIEVKQGDKVEKNQLLISFS